MKTLVNSAKETSDEETIEPCGQRRLDFEMTLVRFYWQEQAKIKLLY